MVDKTTFSQSGKTAPAGNAIAMTADTDLDIYSRSLYIGTGGNLYATMAGDENVVYFANVVSGSILPIRVLNITSDSTASNIVALY